ncbi:MAG TPA: hypothetical protein VFC65_20620, partial [Prolixibacteraceae bacterium]|nr:hypothetical protein [Prolixibacteraceae bacterium]
PANLHQAKISADPPAQKKIRVAHWRNFKKSKIRLSDRYGRIAAMWVNFLFFKECLFQNLQDAKSLV